MNTIKLCPECTNRMIKSGKIRINRAGDKKQQYLCTICGRRTVNPIGSQPDKAIGRPL